MHHLIGVFTVCYFSICGRWVYGFNQPFMTEDKKDDHILHYFGGGGGGGNKACGAEINIRQKKKSLLIH